VSKIGDRLTNWVWAPVDTGYRWLDEQLVSMKSINQAIICTLYNENWSIEEGCRGPVHNEMKTVSHW
jgi:hypothetical protein